MLRNSPSKCPNPKIMEHRSLKKNPRPHQQHFPKIPPSPNPFNPTLQPNRIIFKIETNSNKIQNSRLNSLKFDLLLQLID